MLCIRHTLWLRVSEEDEHWRVLGGKQKKGETRLSTTSACVCAMRQVASAAAVVGGRLVPPYFERHTSRHKTPNIACMLCQRRLGLQNQSRMLWGEVRHAVLTVVSTPVAHTDVGVSFITTHQLLAAKQGHLLDRPRVTPPGVA